MSLYRELTEAFHRWRYQRRMNKYRSEEGGIRSAAERFSWDRFNFVARIRERRLMQQKSGLLSKSTDFDQGAGGFFATILRPWRIPRALRAWRLRRAQAKAMASTDAMPGVSGVRKFRDVLKGTPALLCFLLVGTVSALGFNKQRDAGVSYWQRGEQALIAEDYRAAEVFLQKALSLKSTDKSRISLAMARVYEKQGDKGRAAVLMQSLAPANDVGQPDAHLFMALRMAEQFAQTGKTDLAEWKWHIEHAPTTNKTLIQKLKADYFLATGDLDSSFAAAEQAAAEEPALWMNIALGKRRQGKLEEAQTALLRARDAFSVQYQRAPTDLPGIRNYVMALMLNNELDLAQEVILKARPAHPDGALNPLMAQIYLVYADQAMSQWAKEKKPDQMSNAVRALLEAMKLMPNDPKLLARVTSIGRSENQEESEQVRKALLKIIAAGEANEQAFFTMGVMEWAAGDLQGAIKYTKQALDLDPKLRPASNNLAMFLADQENPELETALKIINETLSDGPELPYLLDTRAHVLTKLGNYEEAITDYLKILKVSANKAYVRGKLAELYDLTGESELAEEMRAAIVPDAPPASPAAEEDNPN